MEKILVNWKTSSAGFLMLIGAVVSIVYPILQNRQPPSQTELMTAITALFGGLGLILSRDIDKSTEATNGHPELEDIGERTGK